MGVHVHLLIERSIDERVLDIPLMDRQSVQRADSTEYATSGLLHHGWCKGLGEINPFLLSATVDYEASLEADNLPEMLLLLENEEAAQDGCTPRWVRYESPTLSLCLERGEFRFDGLLPLDCLVQVDGSTVRGRSNIVRRAHCALYL
jgi:hypothetical protein